MHNFRSLDGSQIWRHSANRPREGVDESTPALQPEFLTISLIIEINSLFRITGNLTLRPRKCSGISDLIRSGGLISEKFPVFSRLNRDPPPETSSPQTPPTAIESSESETFTAQHQATRKNTRFRGVLGVGLWETEAETSGWHESGGMGWRIAKLCLSPTEDALIRS